MRTALAIAACLTAGCGRFEFDDRMTETIDATDPIDTLDAFELGAFGAPIVVSELVDPTSGSDDPSMTEDSLEIFFGTARTGGPGGTDVWSARRNARTDPFGAPTPVTGVNTASDDSGPEISTDGLTMWFASNRAGAGGSDHEIYVTTRLDRSSPWITPVLVPNVNTTNDELALSIGAAGLRMMLQVRLPTGNQDLFEASRASTTSPWSIPQPIVGLDSTTEPEGGPWLSDDGLMLFLHARRGGALASDLYVTTRPTLGSVFEQLVPLSELNDQATADLDPWLSPDLRHIVFASERSGLEQIYEASR